MSVAFLLGRKIGMTQVYDKSGGIVPVTVIEAGPCTVLQVKTAETDGYAALQIGFDDIKPSRAKKPQKGHAAKASTTPKRFVREVRLDSDPQLRPGDQLTVELFSDVEYVDVTGTTKGKGFAGVMKRHGFGGQPASHGVERKHRSPGSIGSHGTDLGHGGDIKKGKRMAGHMGNARRTIRHQALVEVDVENNLLLVKGAVPGPNGGYVIVRKSNKIGP